MKEVSPNVEEMESSFFILVKLIGCLVDMRSSLTISGLCNKGFFGICVIKCK